MPEPDLSFACAVVTRTLAHYTVGFAVIYRRSRCPWSLMTIETVHQ